MPTPAPTRRLALQRLVVVIVAVAGPARGIVLGDFLVRNRDLLLEPTIQIDAAAAFAAKRHGRRLRRIELLVASRTSDLCDGIPPSQPRRGRYFSDGFGLPEDLSPDDALSPPLELLVSDDLVSDDFDDLLSPPLESALAAFLYESLR